MTHPSFLPSFQYLGISVQEASVINAIIPILFIFTPPLAGFLADKLGNFRVLLSILTALGGTVIVINSDTVEKLQVMS